MTVNTYVYRDSLVYLDEFDPVCVEHPGDIWKTGNLFSLYGDEQLLDGCNNIWDIKEL